MEIKVTADGAGTPYSYGNRMLGEDEVEIRVVQRYKDDALKGPELTSYELQVRKEGKWVRVPIVLALEGGPDPE